MYYQDSLLAILITNDSVINKGGGSNHEKIYQRTHKFIDPSRGSRPVLDRYDPVDPKGHPAQGEYWSDDQFSCIWH